MTQDIAPPVILDIKLRGISLINPYINNMESNKNTIRQHDYV